MASVTLIGSASDASAGGVTSLVLTTTADSPAGNPIVVGLGWAGVTTTITSLVDSASNTYVADQSPEIVGLAGDGAAVFAVYRCANPVHLPSGGTITLTLPTARKNICIGAVQIGTATALDTSASGRDDDPTVLSVGPTGTVSGGAEAVLALIVESGAATGFADTFAPDSPWVSVVEVTAANANVGPTTLDIVRQLPTPASGTYTVTGVFTEQGRGSNGYAGLVLVFKPPVTLVTGADSATVTESAGIGLPASDSATETDAGTLGLPASDAGSVTATESALGVASSDSAAGAESAAVAASLASSDSATGVDTLGIAFGSGDSGAGTDSAGLVATIPVSDAAAGAESGVLALAGNDAATASASAAVAITASDAATASASAAVAITASDAATVSESVSVAMSAADSATVVDGGGLGVGGSDAGSGVDLVTLVAQLVALDSGVLAESLTNAATIALADAATAAETGALALMLGDTASVGEVASVVIVALPVVPGTRTLSFDGSRATIVAMSARATLAADAGRTTLRADDTRGTLAVAAARTTLRTG